MEEIVSDAMISVLFAAVSSQQETDSEEPDARLWNSWMNDFIGGREIGDGMGSLPPSANPTPEPGAVDSEPKPSTTVTSGGEGSGVDNEGDGGDGGSDGGASALASLIAL